MKSAFPFLLVALFLPVPRASAAAPPALLRPLSAQARKRLDEVAQKQPPETIVQEHLTRSGNIPAWLLAQAGLAEAEELSRARAVHQRLHKDQKLQPPPARASQTLARLVQNLPPHFRPPSFRYALHLLKRGGHVAYTLGGGFVYVSRPLHDVLVADPRRGESALAFVMARELGHIALLHTRRGWQRVILEEQLSNGISSHVEAGRWRIALDTTLRASGSLVHFLYSRNQEYEADLFALQLCENAGFSPDECLDGLRLVAALQHPDALRRGDYRPELAGTDPLLRLRRLLMEIAGQVDGDFGLLLYDRATGKLSRAADNSVKETDRPLVFVHGMNGGVGSFRAFLAAFGQAKELHGRKLLVFRHPGNSSLARSGRFLHREVRRVIAAPRSATFVCHSAGGLVFRYYAEKLKGEFHKAILIATPHAGSDLMGLKFLVDLVDLAFGAVTLGPVRALVEAIPEGKGEITLDLHPDSLFLRQLGRDPRLAARYHLVVGDYLSLTGALALHLGFAASRRYVLANAVPLLPAGVLKASAARWMAGLRVPQEVLRGDLVVTTTSANLPGAGRVTRLPLHHLSVRSDPRVIALVLDVVREE
jgi:pimeloyl-ACP methyl ester carboxylesterase